MEKMEKMTEVASVSPLVKNYRILSEISEKLPKKVLNSVLKVLKVLKSSLNIQKCFILCRYKVKSQNSGLNGESIKALKEFLQLAGEKNRLTVKLFEWGIA
jgi:hypothetical protein